MSHMTKPKGTAQTHENRLIRRIAVVAPLLLTFGLYGMIVARFYSNALWILLLQLAFFLMLWLYGFAMVVSLIAARQHARSLIIAIVITCFGIVSSFPVTRFMLDRQDERFMSNLSHYEEAIGWIQQHGGATPSDDRFPGLAPSIVVHKDPAGALVVFFRTYPGPFGGRLRGYAYISSDEWNENFVKVYGPPKKLTNNWYRI